MAHFAKLDENNNVIDVNVVDNSDVNDLPFPESEPVGIEFLTNWSGGYSNWKQTSYNANFRTNYAAVGGVYDSENDVFINPSPFASWVLNTELWVYDPPFPKPDDGKAYYWDEPSVSWKERV
jgi:hypothetical protein